MSNKILSLFFLAESRHAKAADIIVTRYVKMVIILESNPQ